ncbi:MAG TPA: response regulator [Candidatus Binatia bacterium]|jgi:DNA-binding response OmpR family regulator|nr:response regulator [Candidatus Binatia bacterium]
MSDKILIVDDDPELLRLVGLALHRAGYEPVAAQSAEDALKKVRSEQPALVILDVMLPGASGIDLCRQLRGQARTLPLPIIMLSARAQVDDKIEGLEAGADEYLTKPVSPKEMVARVKSLLARTERLRSAAAPAHGTVIGVLGAKGGVGTTTIVLNMAVALAQKDQNVIAVEMRSQYGTFAVQLGHAPPETISDLVAEQNSRIDERALRTHLTQDASGIEVLYGPQESGARITIEADEAEAIIEGLARMAAIVILDFAHDLSPATEAALKLCDQVLLVTRPENDSLTAGRKMLDAVRDWGVGRGVVDAIVVNHVPLAMGLNIREAEEQLDCHILGVVPPAADAAALVHKRGRPLLITQSNNAAANKIVQLADQLLTKELA